jgi:hypothetical protein
MGPFINAGLAVTSHDTSALNTSTFDHVLIASQATMDIDIGDVGIAGQDMFSTTTNMYAMQGGGGHLGHGRRVLLSLSEHHERRANGGPHQQSRRHECVCKSGIDAAQFHRRLGGPRDSRRTTGPQRRVHDPVRCRRVDDLHRGRERVVSGLAEGGAKRILDNRLVSADGAGWTLVGMTSTAIASDALIGVAVTSHERAVLTTATFDNLSR